MSVPRALPETRSSFSDLIASIAPETLPRPSAPETALPHATTIVACTFAGGVAMAGDRRATWSHQIVSRDIEKVFAADAYMLMGVAGTAGIALDLVRLFQVELEHYEKVETVPLSFEGKVNRLGGLLRGRLEAALRGLGVVPLLAGWDGSRGRIISYDVTGGHYEETGFYSVGSGSTFARGSLKKLHSSAHSEHDAVRTLLHALVDSADEDSATAGLDPVRHLYPTVMTVTASGVTEWTASAIEELAHEVIDQRMSRPDGPEARHA